LTDAEIHNEICWKGNWTLLKPGVCGGNIEVWDQTLGCPDCGMNLWYLPEFGQWPAWDIANEPPDDWWAKWKTDTKAYNPYEPYFKLFDKLHPFVFSDCHDPGDEHHGA
jgi:hypothetical protein